MDALRIIDQGAAQIALVVDEQQLLLGTLTDGDIRRGLLHGVRTASQDFTLSVMRISLNFLKDENH